MTKEDQGNAPASSEDIVVVNYNRKGEEGKRVDYP